jgi:hypothetical protein
LDTVGVCPVRRCGECQLQAVTAAGRQPLMSAMQLAADKCCDKRQSHN